jgi:hypothetical protein
LLDGGLSKDSTADFAIVDADPASFRVIAGADPRTFPPYRAVTNCSETSISFAD